MYVNPERENKEFLLISEISWQIIFKENFGLNKCVPK